MSKTFTIKRTVQGTMAEIEATKAQPITKAVILPHGRDAAIIATELVAEMFANVQEQANKWHGFCWRVIEGTTDMRVLLLSQIDTRLEAMRTENAEHHGWDDKTAKRSMSADGAVGSYTVNVSRIRTIAKAFNGGATVEGLAAFHQVSDPRNLGWRAVYDYAKTFTKSAAGRKPDSLKVAFGKWLAAKAKEQATFTDDDLVTYNRLVAFNNQL